MEGRPFTRLLTGVVVVTFGCGLAALRFVNGVAAERNLEGAVGALALGAVVAAAGVLAILSIWERPILLLPAAIVLMPLSMLSFALVTLPLIVPAVVLFLAYQRSADRAVPPARAGATVAVVVSLLVAAVITLFIHQDPRSYVTATGGGSTSDVITFAESMTSLALTVLALVGGWALSRRSPDVSEEA